MRTDEEMQNTLRTLQLEFGVDVSPAAGLHGPDLVDWIDRALNEVFEREHAELRAQRAQMEHSK